MVKPSPWENDMLDTMWAFMQMGGLKADYPALKEACMELRQMMMQKTAGQRKDKPKDLSWDNLERVKVTIICEAMALVLSGEYEEAGACSTSCMTMRATAKSTRISRMESASMPSTTSTACTTSCWKAMTFYDP